MGRAILNFDKIHIDGKRSDCDHADNDYLSMVWAVNDKVYSKTVPMYKPGGDPVLQPGDDVAPYGDYVVCQNTDTVIVTYAAINLGSTDWSDQAEAATRLTQKIADTVGPIYLEAAALVLGFVGSGGTFGAAEAEELIKQLSEEGSPLLDELSGKAGELIDSAFDQVITPFVKAIVDELRVLAGHPDCNGDVFHDYVIFLPRQPETDLTITKPYEGRDRNTGCQTPRTTVTLRMRREFDVLQQNEWRECTRCGGMFYNGYPEKGPCPGFRFAPLGGAPRHGPHVAGDRNFALPHDTPGIGQALWHFCHKCNLLFYDGYKNKGACIAGGGHECMGYNFDLPHDLPIIPLPKGFVIKQQANWHYCVKCHVLFNGGEANKGVCAAGGAHEPAGFNFVLPFS